MSRAKSTVIVAVVALLAIGGLLTAAVVLNDSVGLGESDDSQQPTEQGDTAGGDTNATDSGGDEQPPEQVDTDSEGDDDENVTTPEDSDGPSDDDGSEEQPHDNDDDGNETVTDEEPVDDDTNSTDSDSNETDGPDPVDKDEVIVEVELQDLGFPDAGEMRLREHPDGEVIETHNFSEEGHNRNFRRLDPGQLYDVVIDTPYYPPEDITFYASRNDIIERTVGYEFNSTDSYRTEWEVGYLPQYFEGSHLSEEAEEEAIPLFGETRTDAEGNYYTEWDDPAIRGKTQYYYNETSNRSFRSGPNVEWKTTRSHWGDADATHQDVIEQGLSGVENRTFLGIEEPSTGIPDELHLYEISADVFGSPVVVKINPETGYPNEFELLVKKMADSGVTRETTRYEEMIKEIEVMPSDFPESKFNITK